MEKFFKDEEGKLHNIIEHTLEQIEKWPNLKIYVGTDSQVYGGIVRYVTAVVYRYGHRGAHYIYRMEDMRRMNDDFLRLYTEGAKTIEISEILTSELPVAIEAMEFDYADVKKTLSSKLVSAFKGITNARFKSGEMIATKAADHICRKKCS